MAREFDVVVEKDSEGFFVASVPALSGCHTQARSLYELMVRVKEAIRDLSGKLSARGAELSTEIESTAG